MADNAWGGDGRDPYKHAGKNIENGTPFQRSKGGFVSVKTASRAGGASKQRDLRPDSKTKG